MVDLSAVGQRPREPRYQKSSDGTGETPSYKVGRAALGETQSRIVITCSPLDAVKVVERAKLMGVPAAPIGKVGGEQLVIKCRR